MFEQQYETFWLSFGQGRKMVLSTALYNVVTSRMMSVVALDGSLYFQTDKTFRKYHQLSENPHVALCIDNIQIEGICSEIGKPMDHAAFCTAFKACFPDAFRRYSLLKNERLFVVSPRRIERWLYMADTPYVETFDVAHKRYALKQYTGK